MNQLRVESIENVDQLMFESHVISIVKTKRNENLIVIEKHWNLNQRKVKSSAMFINWSQHQLAIESIAKPWKLLFGKFQIE